MNKLARRLGTGAMVVALSGLSTAAVAPADAAAAKKCVSKGEYDTLKKGQTRTKVKQVLDGQKVLYGFLVPGGTSFEQYETCGWSDKYVTLFYEGGLGSPYQVKTKSLKGFLGPTS